MEKSKSNELPEYKYYPYMVTIGDLCFRRAFQQIFITGEQVESEKKFIDKLRFKNIL